MSNDSADLSPCNGYVTDFAKKRPIRLTVLKTKTCQNQETTRGKQAGKMAGPTRLELATSGVTGRRSNRLNYDPTKGLQL